MSQYLAAPERALTLNDLRRLRAAGEPIVALTAYDASFAAVMDAAGVEYVLVGDSLGMVVQGQQTTVPVTVEDICYHTRSVARGLRRAVLVADMPFGSFNSVGQALDNAVRLMQAGAQMVKLEATGRQADLVASMAERGIPVCAHIGLQPQLVHKLGGYRVQGRDAGGAAAMRDDARTLVEAGADMLLIECVSSPLAAQITRASAVPVIGIGAGAEVDGQVLVLYDVLGISIGRTPRFARNFLADHGDIGGAIAAYVHAVKTRAFPAAGERFD